MIRKVYEKGIEDLPSKNTERKDNLEKMAYGNSLRGLPVCTWPDDIPSHSLPNGTTSESPNEGRDNFDNHGREGVESSAAEGDSHPENDD